MSLPRYEISELKEMRTDVLLGKPPNDFELADFIEEHIDLQNKVEALENDLFDLHELLAEAEATLADIRTLVTP